MHVEENHRMLFDKLTLNYLSVKLLLLLLITLSFETSFSQTYFNNLEGSFDNQVWISTSTIKTGFSHSGTHFSLTDSIQPYGLGIEMDFPEARRGQNTIIEIKGWVKSNVENPNANYVITIVDNSENVVWKGIPLSKIISGKDQWFRFIDSIFVPADITATSKVKAYLWNAGKKHEVGIDDLRITYKEMQTPSFIPELTSILPEYPKPKSLKTIYSNDYYSVIYSRRDKTLKITDKKGNDLINNMIFFSYRNIDGSKFESDIAFRSFRPKKSDKGKVLKFKIKDRGYKVKVSLICNMNQKINVEIEEEYTKNQTVIREALVFNYNEPLSQVYRNNRFVDTVSFQKEYWLDKQGVKIGDGNKSFIIYHTPGISSQQLNTEHQLLYANLDYDLDHPFFRFPLNPDSNNWKKDESTSKYEKGDKRKFSFNIVIGNKTHSLPRFMKNHLGFEATYIWTEHADFSNIRTNRATYFGSEKVNHQDSAVGGFVKFNIPVTKSVFYDNPDSITNIDASGGTFTSLESTILTDKKFSEFLFQIAAKGSEICLHTPEQYTTTKERLEEALEYMQQNFGSPSWIDHGNNNGLQNNREDLICDATLKESPYYAIKLWNEYGVKYLHNAYYEEYNTYQNWQFTNSLEKPYSGYGDFFPKPDYYQHPTRSGSMIHWTTTSALFVKEPHLWNYLFNYNKLNNLVENRAVEINHVYPAWVDPKKGMWTYNEDSVIIAQPGFNIALSNLAKLRDEGKINICTINEFLDYLTAIDKIDYNILPDGRIKLTNNGNRDISGLSMVAKAKKVTIDSLTPPQKIVDDEIIFWFNLAAGESKIVEMIN